MRGLAKLLLIGAIAYQGYAWWRGSSGSLAPIAYTDTRGAPHLLGAGKPAVVTLWVTPCSYSQRALRVMDQVRGEYAENDVDVVGFYLNRASDAQIDGIAAEKSHVVAQAQGQPNAKFVENLTKSLAFTAPGRAIYVVRPDGGYDVVDAGDLKTPDDVLRGKVATLLRVKLGLKPRG